MKPFETAILNEVRKEIEYVDEDYHYSQWLLALAVKEADKEQCIDGLKTYHARIVTKTDECIPVDGLDISFIQDEEGMISAPEFFENSPTFIGGPVDEAMVWLQEFGEVCYLQLDNPFFP